MLYVMMHQGCAVESTTVHQTGPSFQNRNDWKDWDTVVRIADELTRSMGIKHLPVDRSASTSPRFDVIRAPTVGADVSKGFNGDYYPAGQILRISASFRRIATSDGTVFWRVRNSGTWLANMTWAMCYGHIDKRNPSF